MSYLQIFKRIIPFFLTFAAGLLIASIFVPIGSPFRNADRSGNGRFRSECKRERESLRRENDRLRQELETMRQDLEDAKFSNLDRPVPDFGLEPSAPPLPPRVNR